MIDLAGDDAYEATGAGSQGAGLGGVGLAAAALVVTVDNNNKLDDLSTELDQLPQSP